MLFRDCALEPTGVASRLACALGGGTKTVLLSTRLPGATCGGGAGALFLRFPLGASAFATSDNPVSVPTTVKGFPVRKHSQAIVATRAEKTSCANEKRARRFGSTRGRQSTSVTPRIMGKRVCRSETSPLTSRDEKNVVSVTPRPSEKKLTNRWPSQESITVLRTVPPWT